MKYFSKAKIALVSLGMVLSIASCSSGTPMSDFEKQTREIYESGLRDGSIKDQTYEQWLESIRGKDGKDGQDGHSPTIRIGENGNWFIDNIDTGISATGPAGKDGQDGKDGVDGQNGKDGTDGKDGVDGQNGTDGKDGVDGKDGISIVSISLTSSSNNVDTYTILYSDGTTSTFTVTNGVDGQSIKGDKGEDGHTPVITISSDGYWVIDGIKTSSSAKGIQGEQGVSIVSITLDDSIGLNDYYLIKYSDGTTSYFTVTNGKNGEQGIQGEKGADGHTPVITIENGMWVVDGVSTGIAVQGPQGDVGPQGQTAWSNTILPSEHGYVDVNAGSALVGEEITFGIHPDTYYALDYIALNGVDYYKLYDDSSKTLTVNMVEHGYVVRPHFAPIVQILNKEDIFVYGSLDLLVKVGPENIDSPIAGLTVESSNPSVISVSNLTLSALHTGTSTIRVSYGSQSDSYLVTVSGDDIVGIETVRSELKMDVNKTYQVDLYYVYASGSRVKVNSNEITFTKNNDHISITNTGLVTSLSYGVTVLTYEAHDISGTITFTITDAVDSPNKVILHYHNDDGNCLNRRFYTWVIGVDGTERTPDSSGWTGTDMTITLDFSKIPEYDSMTSLYFVIKFAGTWSGQSDDTQLSYKDFLPNVDGTLEVWLLNGEGSEINIFDHNPLD